MKVLDVWNGPVPDLPGLFIRDDLSPIRNTDILKILHKKKQSYVNVVNIYIRTLSNTH